MAKGVLVVETIDILPITAKGATVCYTSGGYPIMLRIDLDDYRVALELATQRLLEYDESQRQRVIRFPKGGRAKH